MIKQVQMSLSGPTQIPTQLAPIAEHAAELGLQFQGCVRLGSIDENTAHRLGEWLDAGRAGEMGYLERRKDELINPQKWKSWGRSILLFAAPYFRPSGGFKGGGRVARYALGRDYHNVLSKRLERLGKRLRSKKIVERYRGLSDAAPLLEREWALQGGLGFRGKNTLVLSPSLGSWQFLAELIVDQELPEWRLKDSLPSCGTCTSCLDACPTKAFDGEWLLDPRKCISYLTIETKGTIPRQLRRGIGDWVFGCDVCQEVCPFGSEQVDFSNQWGSLPVFEEWTLEDLLLCSKTEFKNKFTGSPVRRPGWATMQRNACIALGNLKRGESVLKTILSDHSETVVRAHSAWALGELGELDFLKNVHGSEIEAVVREEISQTIDAQ